MAVIELDLDAPPAAPPARPPARWYRMAGLALAGVLTLALGGAAPVTSTLWQRLGVVPLSPPDTMFALAGGDVYTTEGLADGRSRTTSWTGPALRRTWSVTTGAASDDPDVHGYGGVSVTPAGAVVLLSDPAATTVVDARTGAVRWTATGPLLHLGAGVGVTSETTFRPGSEYDADGGAPGELYFSSSGRPYTEPPQRSTLHGVDLATGRRLWSSGYRGSVRTTRAAGGGPAVVVAAADRLAVLAGDTGAVLRTTPLPDADVAWAEFAGDLLLLRGGPTDEPGTLSAYAIDSLKFRWRTADPPVFGAAGLCLDVPCGNGASGRAVLDVRTGQPIWQAEPDLSVQRLGGAAVEVGIASGRPVRVRDLATGAVRARLTSWDSVVQGTGPLVVRRADVGRGRTEFGVLLPGSSAVRPLGTSAELVDDCLADERHVACRTPAGLQVWAYRA